MDACSSLGSYHTIRTVPMGINQEVIPMASSYTPTNVNQGFGAETEINQNFTDIKTALDEALNRLATATNAMGIDLDMGNNQILNLPVATVATDPVLFSQLNSLAVKEVTQDLTYAAAIEVDIEQVTFAKLTLTGNTTITVSGTPNDGQPFLIAVRQDATGSHTITWDSRVRFSNELPNVDLTGTALSMDYILFRYNADDDKLDAMATNRGFF